VFAVLKAEEEGALRVATYRRSSPDRMRDELRLLHSYVIAYIEKAQSLTKPKLTLGNTVVMCPSAVISE
jgi:hypothetical protein